MISASDHWPFRIRMNEYSFSFWKILRDFHLLGFPFDSRTSILGILRFLDFRHYDHTSTRDTVSDIMRRVDSFASSSPPSDGWNRAIILDDDPSTLDDQDHSDADNHADNHAESICTCYESIWSQSVSPSQYQVWSQDRRDSSCEEILSEMWLPILHTEVHIGTMIF